MEDDSPSGRDWTRIGLILACVLAAVAAAVLVPTVTSGGLAGSPADRVLPGDQFPGSDDGGSGEDPTSFGEGDGGLGALNPGDETGIGGRIGADDTYNNTDTEVHFRVESGQPAYWRTGTYDRYTGSGWEQTGTNEPYAEPIDHDGLAGEQFTYEVQLERSANRLPTAWRVDSVGGVDTPLAVTPGAAIATGETVQSGTSYTATSTRPERDVQVLRSADGEIPAAIEQQYTALPEETPERIGDLTADIIADTDSQYDAAMAVQTWLRTEKEYSLEVSASGDQIADQFIFEMEAGYCEYFATAMVAMLRSQGIPARYTVGYSTGEQVEDGVYEVRGMNAHAWVEVYFPEVGWVQFEPTPGDERLSNQADALDGNAELVEEGSPGETFRSDGDDSDNGEENGDTDPITDDGLAIELNRTAVPGATVEVRVTEDGESVIGREVLFNGEKVGVTDEQGTVVATVPFAEELRITLGEPVVTGPTMGTATAGDLTGLNDEEGETFPVETEASVTVTGQPVPGGEVTVTATVEDVPLQGATVAVDGEPAGATDENGQATVTLPDRSGEVPVTVEREPVVGETTVDVLDIQLDVTADWPVALPGTTVTATVTTDDDEPVAGAEVLLGGEAVETTGPDGTATVTLPLSREATVTATYRGLERQATVGGLVRNAALVLIGLVAVVGATGATLARRGYSIGDLLRITRAAPGVFLTYANWALVLLVTRGGTLLGQAGRHLLTAAGAVAALVRGRQSPRELWLRLRAWLWEARRRLARRRDEPVAVPADEGDGRSAAHRSVREAWQQFLQRVSVDRMDRYTPGELARHAIEEDDLPDEPVHTLRDAFREVEYGDRPASSQAEQVRQAIDEIEGNERATDGGDRGGR